MPLSFRNSRSSSFFVLSIVLGLAVQCISPKSFSTKDCSACKLVNQPQRTPIHKLLIFDLTQTIEQKLQTRTSNLTWHKSIAKVSFSKVKDRCFTIRDLFFACFTVPMC